MNRTTNRFVNISTLLAVLVCLPVSVAVGASYAHELSPSMSINDVWMQYGGARLHYLALAGSRQTWAAGAIGTDPASLPKLPPLKPWSEKKRTYYGAKKAVSTKPAPPKNVSSTPASPPPAYTPMVRPGQSGDPLGGLNPSSFSKSTPAASAPAQKQAATPPATGSGMAVAKPPVTPQQQLWPATDTPVVPRSTTPVTPPAAPSIIDGVNTPR